MYILYVWKREREREGEPSQCKTYCYYWGRIGSSWMLDRVYIWSSFQFWREAKLGHKLLFFEYVQITNFWENTFYLWMNHIVFNAIYFEWIAIFKSTHIQWIDHQANVMNYIRMYWGKSYIKLLPHFSPFLHSLSISFQPRSHPTDVAFLIWLLRIFVAIPKSIIA